MTTPVKWIIIAVIVILGIFATDQWWQTRKERKDAVIEQKLKDAKVVDSSHAAHLDTLSRQIDTVVKTVVQTITKVKTITEKVQLPGRVDSVFKDSAFAALPDSQKVEVLRQVARQQAAKCSELVSTCQRFRDSAFVALHHKDSTIDLWQQRYENKPRRRCGPGVGLGGGLTANGSGLSGGATVLAGYVCSL